MNFGGSAASSFVALRLMPVRVTYDASVDAAYIYLREIGAAEVRHTHTAEPEIQTDMINLDFDADARLIGIEVLSASRHLPPELLADAP
jgi:uncharacterized protein YuzE